MGRYWDARAQSYKTLDWVDNQDAVSALIRFLAIKPEDFIMDIGCGIGNITHAISRSTRYAVGIDSSRGMITRARAQYPDIPFFENDAFAISGRYDKALVRMMLHHIVDRQKLDELLAKLTLAVDQLYIVEAIPPTDDCLEFFSTVFAIKEERLSFTQQQWIDQVSASWRVEQAATVRFPMSIDKWLAGDTSLSPEKKARLYDLHLHAPAGIREPYRLRRAGGELLLDTTHLMLRCTGVNCR